MAHPDKKLPNLNSATKNIQKEMITTNKQHINRKGPHYRLIIFVGCILIIISLVVIGLHFSLNEDAHHTLSKDLTGTDTAPEVNYESEVTMYVEINGVKIEDGGTYSVQPGDIIEVEASSINARIAFIGYYWDTKENEITDEYDNHLTIHVPENEPGTEKVLFIEAVAANNDGDKNPETRTGWLKYYLVYKPDVVENKTASVLVNDVEITAGTTVKVKSGAEIQVSVTPDEYVEQLFYRIDNGDIQSVSQSTAMFSLSESAVTGSSYTLEINALYNDGLFIDGNDEEHTSSFIYYFEVIE